jgi:hypothetical protein
MGISALAAALVLQACDSSTAPPAALVPLPFNDVRPAGLVATARAQYDVLGGETPVVEIFVELENPGAEAVSLSFMGGGCFIRLIAYSDPGLSQRSPLWNGLLDPGNCPDIGEVVTVLPQERATLSHAVLARPVVREALARRAVFALAVLQESGASRPLGIDAGQIAVFIPD